MRKVCIVVLIVLIVVGTVVYRKASHNDGGSLKDIRDGQIYRTIQIGDQVWMAENLNYDNIASGKSYCYDDKPENCQKYGRLYTWKDAVKACPIEWHLPTLTDWNTLLATVGGKDKAGKVLKAANGWNKDGNGSDSWGFSAVPGGGRDEKGVFDGMGSFAFFWVSAQDPNGYPLITGLTFSNENSLLIPLEGDGSVSVRCIKFNY